MKKATLVSLLVFGISQVLALELEEAQSAHHSVQFQRKFEMPEAAIHESLMANYNVTHEEANQIMDGSHPMLKKLDTSAKKPEAQPAVGVSFTDDDSMSFSQAAHTLGIDTTYIPAKDEDKPKLVVDHVLHQVESLKKIDMPDPIVRQQLQEDGFDEQEIQEALAAYHKQLQDQEQHRQEQATHNLQQQFTMDQSDFTASDRSSEQQTRKTKHVETAQQDLAKARLPQHLDGKLAIAKKLQEDVFGSKPVMLTEAETEALKTYFIQHDFEVSGVQAQGPMTEQERIGIVKATRRFTKELVDQMSKDAALRDAVKSHGVQGVFGDRFAKLDEQRRKTIEETVQSELRSNTLEKVSMFGISAALLVLVIGGIIASVIISN